MPYLWRALQFTFYGLGWPLYLAGAWLVEAADICRDRAEAHEPQQERTP